MRQAAEELRAQAALITGADETGHTPESVTVYHDAIVEWLRGGRRDRQRDHVLVFRQSDLHARAVRRGRCKFDAVGVGLTALHAEPQRSLQLS